MQQPLVHHHSVATDAPPVLELRGISKRFPGVVALNDVNFDLRAGEVHVLVGENGAGKSTLVKILSGIYQPDEGEILLDGQTITLPDPHAAQQAGISTVHQELNLVPHLDVGRNMYLGREPLRGLGVIDWPQLYRGAATQLSRLGMSFSPRSRVGDLGVALQQMTEIAKALVAKARVLILDEPTAAITAEEAKMLFTIVDTLARAGSGGHLHLPPPGRCHPHWRSGDVLRDGKQVATLPMAETTPRSSSASWLAANWRSSFPSRPHEAGPVALKVTKLHRRGVLQDISFDVRQGEIVGLAGLVGAGRTEVARAIFGIDRIDSGQIEIHGKPLTIAQSATGHSEPDGALA